MQQRGEAMSSTAFGVGSKQDWACTPSPARPSADLGSRRSSLGAPCVSSRASYNSVFSASSSASCTEIASTYSRSTSIDQGTFCSSYDNDIFSEEEEQQHQEQQQQLLRMQSKGDEGEEDVADDAADDEDCDDADPFLMAPPAVVMHQLCLPTPGSLPPLRVPARLLTPQQPPCLPEAQPWGSSCVDVGQHGRPQDPAAGAGRGSQHGLPVCASARALRKLLLDSGLPDIQEDDSRASSAAPSRSGSCLMLTALEAARTDVDPGTNARLQPEEPLLLPLPLPALFVAADAADDEPESASSDDEDSVKGVEQLYASYLDSLGIAGIDPPSFLESDCGEGGEELQGPLHDDDDCVLCSSPPLPGSRRHSCSSGCMLSGSPRSSDLASSAELSVAGLQEPALASPTSAAAAEPAVPVAAAAAEAGELDADTPAAVAAASSAACMEALDQAFATTSQDVGSLVALFEGLASNSKSELEEQACLGRSTSLRKSLTMHPLTAAASPTHGDDGPPGVASHALWVDEEWESEGEAEGGVLQGDEQEEGEHMQRLSAVDPVTAPGAHAAAAAARTGSEGADNCMEAAARVDEHQTVPRTKRSRHPHTSKPVKLLQAAAGLVMLPVLHAGSRTALQSAATHATKRVVAGRQAARAVRHAATHGRGAAAAAAGSAAVSAAVQGGGAQGRGAGGFRLPEWQLPWVDSSNQASSNPLSALKFWF